MRAVGPLLLLVVLVTGCSRLGGTAAPAAPGIEARTPIVPEERSTCAALERVDLAVVGADEAARARSAAGLEQAARRSPADAVAFTALADAYRTSARAAWHDPRRADVVAWFNQRCGGMR